MAFFYRSCLCLGFLSFLLVNLVVPEYYPEEREALLLLINSLTSASNLHGNWTGPPCIANQSRWEGITCSNWHVVHIALEGIELLGSLPPTFLQNITFLTQVNLRNNLIYGNLPNLTNLMFLEHVLLSYNRFSGLIPIEYVGLPRLKELELQENHLDGQIPPFDQTSLINFNVSYNHLVGPIPQTSVLMKFPKSSFVNNSGLCGKPLDKPPAPFPAPPPAIIIPPSPAKEEQRKRLHVWAIALIAAAAVLIPLLVITAFLFCKTRAHGKETTRNESAGYGFRAWAENIMSHSVSTEDPERSSRMEIFTKELPVFDLDDLLRASAEMLGKGNLGTTYKATLETGAVVAVKRLDYRNGLSKREFLQHMHLLGRLKHENLVEIISFYYSEEEKLVVYEFISNCSLFELLHENRRVGRTPLDWSTRLAVIKGIAKGLDFLHNSLPSHKVPHANLRTSNVLIHQDDNGFHSKLTDFGFLHLLSAKKSAEKLAISRLPEFVQGKKLTHKADVYCFGIIILEIITGKVPGEILGEVGERTSDLSEWVRTVVNNDWSTDILDEEILAAREGHGAMFELTELALQCTDTTPENRPKMNEVLIRIEEIEQMKTEND
ncbi:putative leucine-rich repeat receptor-like protein kinase [Senna tora]|uniref:Putative leucine-rich repeat receptor-like protein kinase n=1 Tax=Senna tora TaxID=362788 RepID=A0A834WI74_9FABA|nr:putative leucine-rich repeat receptor-like protein kinase [Senna tora]